MRKLLYPILLIGAALLISSWMRRPANQKSEPKLLISGSIMQTISYCGGAPPSRKILDGLNTPKGIPFGRLFVKIGATNVEDAPVIDTIKADEKGNFSTYLPAGNYCLLEEWKAKPFKLPLNTANQTVDSTCFRSLYNACDFKLIITDKSIDHIKIIFHRTCPYNQPCITYHGALPQ
jgi:hypothetical protein